MGTTLTGKRVQNTYDSLLKLSDNDNLTGTPKIVGSGLGTDSPIYLSTTRVGIGMSPTVQFQTSGDAQIGNNLVVGGNLTVNGTTTYIDSTIVEIGDNMIELAKDNTANIKDIGWYGTINDGSEKFVGVFYDASTGTSTPTFKIGLGTAEPSSTAAWTVKGKIVIGQIDSTGGTFSGQITIPQTPTADGHAASKKYVDDQIGGADKARRVTITVKNTETVALSAGTVVHAHPTAPVPSGNIVQVKKADYDTASLMPAIAILNEDLDAAGGTNDEGEAIMFGFINGIDTSSFSAGDELYVGNDGALTNSKPLLTTQLIQKIAVVMKVDSTNGSIEVFGAGRSNDVPNEVDRDLSIAGNLKVDDYIEIEADSGYGRLEIGGPDGGYIDLKTPFSDDYDLRIITNSSGSEFTGSGDFNINAGNTLTLTLDGTTQDATFAGNINLAANKYILIGTDSGDAFNSASAIRIQDTSHAYIQMKVGTSSQGGVLIGDIDDDYVGGFVYNNSSNTLTFKQNNVDCLTISGSQSATFAGDVTVSGGDIILGGTGRIQGIDTITDGTDAVNKNYVDDNFVDGSGTANDVAMWLDSDTLTDAPIAISGNNATFTGDIYGNLIELEGVGFKGGEGDVLDDSDFNESGVGNTFRWVHKDSSTSGSTWQKVADVTLDTFLPNGCSMDVKVILPNDENGNSASQETLFYSVSFRGADSDTVSYGDAIVYGPDDGKLRVYKSATRTYELQARTEDNDRSIIVEYTITSKYNAKVILTESITAGTTSGGTAYTATQNNNNKTKFAGELDFLGVTIGDDLRINGNLFFGPGADTTYGGFLTQYGGSDHGVSMTVEDTDGFVVNTVYGAGGEAYQSFSITDTIELKDSNETLLEVSLNKIDISAPTEINIGESEVGLSVYTTNVSTTPNVKFGRDANQYIGFSVGDRYNEMIFRQDETTGTASAILDIWSSTTGNVDFTIRKSNNTGGSSTNWMVIQDGDTTFAGDVETTDGILEIYKYTDTSGTSTGTTLLSLTNNVGTAIAAGDLQQQKTFIDFNLLDGNDNEYPQVRIGAEVGQNGNADSQIKEGAGAFVVYTNNSTGTGPTPTGLAERFRVDYEGKGTFTNDLQVTGNITSSTSSGNHGIKVITANDAEAFIILGDPEDNSMGGMAYNNATNTLDIDCNNAVALSFDSSQNATFAGNVTLGSSTSGETQLTLFTQAESDTIINYRESTLNYGFTTMYDATANLFRIKRHDNSVTGVTVMSMPRTVSEINSHADLIPSADSTYDLGSTTKYWANVYADNITLGDKLNAPVTIQGTSTGLLKLYQDTNAGGAAIEFSDLATTQAQKGYLTYRHSNTQSQNSGESFHFTGTETDISIVAGDSTQVGKFIASGGSAAETAFSFYDDPDTGMYQPSGNQIGFSAGGIQRVVISGDLNVENATDINVNGTSRRLNFTAGTGTVRTTTANNLYFAANSVTRQEIKTNGDIEFTANLMPVAENAWNIGSASTRWEDLYVDDGFIRDAYIDEYIYHNGDTNTYIRFTTDQMDFRTNGDDRLTILSNGNVGVGVSPSTKFHVNSGTLSDIVTFSNNNGGYVFGNTSNQGSLDLSSTSYRFRIRQGSREAFYVDTQELILGDLINGQSVHYQTRIGGKSIYGGGGTGPYGNYGAIVFHATTNYTGGARRFMLSNAYKGNSFVIIRSADASTDPAIDGDDGTVSSGSADFGINQLGYCFANHRLSVGHESPSKTLHVLGSTRFDKASLTDPDTTSTGRYPAAHMFTYTDDTNGISIIGGQGNHTGTNLMLGQETGRSTAFKFIKGVSDTNGTDQEEFYIDGVGNAFFEGNVGINSGLTHPLNVRKDGSSGSATIVAQFTSANSLRPTISFSESAATGITAGMSIEYNGTGSGDTNYMSINAVDGNSAMRVYSGGTSVQYGPNPIMQIIAESEGESGMEIYDAQDFGQNGKVLWSAATNDMTFVLNSSNRFRMYDNGDFHADGDVVAYSTSISDAKLKDNVVVIDNALEKVKQLNGVSYIWNKGSRKGKKDLGVIAQEVEKVLPEIVHEKEMRLLDGETYKTVDYEKLTAVLIESVKELSAKVEALENKKCNCNCK